MAEQLQTTAYQINCECSIHQRKLKYFTLKKQGENKLYCQKCSAPSGKMTINKEIQTIISNISKKKQSFNENAFKQKQKFRIQSYLNFLRNKKNQQERQLQLKMRYIMNREEFMIKSKFDKHSQQVKKMIQPPCYIETYKDKKKRFLQILLTDKDKNIQNQLLQMKKNLSQLQKYLNNHSFLSELQDLLESRTLQQNRKK